MSVNKVQLANGETIIDISDSTVTPETLAEGVTAHDASGQKITGKMVPGGGSKTVQTDWNQTDETAADFIKNKPFGEGIVECIPETEIVGAEMEGLLFVEMPALNNIGEAETIYVTFDGVEYICDLIPGEGYYGYGNGSMLDMGDDTGEPFLIYFVPGYMCGLFTQDTETHSVSISTLAVIKLPTKYYDKATTFYRNMADDTDLYLYADIGITTKVMLEDLSSLGNAPVYVQYAYMGVGFSFMELAVRVDWDDAATGGVYVWKGTSNAELEQLHVAEYTGT